MLHTSVLILSEVYCVLQSLSCLLQIPTHSCC